MFNSLRSAISDKLSDELKNLKVGGSKDSSPQQSQSNLTTSSTPVVNNANHAPPPGSVAGSVHRALLIGINYTGTKAALSGCINDVKNVQNYLRKKQPHFTEFLVLTDDQSDPSKLPTKKNIIAGFAWLIAGAKRGDSFFLHFSGHGGSVPDLNGDEHDGMDETILPLDFEKNGELHDDELHRLLLTDLPEGVRFTALFDSCHSGSALDLAFTYQLNGSFSEPTIVKIDNRKEALKHAANAAKNFFSGQSKEAMGDAQNALKSYFKFEMERRKGNPTPKTEAPTKVDKKSTKATVTFFSGCADAQTSADATIGGQPSGAMSWALLECLNMHSSPVTYLQVLKETRALLHGKYEQIPQLSTGFETDMDNTYLTF
ncbi:Ca(2+)-dependent cysteine protease [Clydaea vesicula]|uniref:Ca(2+)-dependent cysteine protease n=1 Tax=Clydaea vesicula TaxID=447962 RepID=A0AAD5UA28_9FUNG|nr:Ca(2+)-dependent cysteine protease [Clydaea vesicula]KAJ3390730.1 Ca(2+)-dependent cysteine protease [Lobulomyces angularis]